MFSPVLLDLIETAEQFSIGDVILHVTGRLICEIGAKTVSLDLQDVSVGQVSRIVKFVSPLMLKFWNNGSSDVLVVIFVDLSAQHRRLARRNFLLKVLILLEMTSFCGISKYLLPVLFVGYILFPFWTTLIFELVSIWGTSRVVVRILEEHWVVEVFVGTRVVITIAVSFARFIIC